MVCPFGISLEQGVGPPSNCGVALVVTVRRHSLSVEAAEDVAYELGRVLIRYAAFQCLVWAKTYLVLALAWILWVLKSARRKWRI